MVITCLPSAREAEGAAVAAAPGVGGSARWARSAHRIANERAAHKGEGFLVAEH